MEAAIIAAASPFGRASSHYPQPDRSDQDRSDHHPDRRDRIPRPPRPRPPARRGDRVVALVRDAAKLARTRSEPLGDRGRPARAAAAPSAGLRADALVHAAACVDFDAGLDELMRVNRDSTRRVVELALRAGVTRAVLVSSTRPPAPALLAEIPAPEGPAGAPGDRLRPLEARRRSRRSRRPATPPASSRRSCGPARSSAKTASGSPASCSTPCGTATRCFARSGTTTAGSRSTSSDVVEAVALRPPVRRPRHVQPDRRHDADGRRSSRAIARRSRRTSAWRSKSSPTRRTRGPRAPTASTTPHQSHARARRVELVRRGGPFPQTMIEIAEGLGFQRDARRAAAAPRTARA